MYVFSIYRAFTTAETNARALIMQLPAKEKTSEEVLKAALTLSWLKSQHLPVDISNGRMKNKNKKKKRDLPQNYSVLPKAMKGQLQTYHINAAMVTFSIIIPKIKEQHDAITSKLSVDGQTCSKMVA